MSKRDQFKALLDESGDTGTEQKGRILDAHLDAHLLGGNPSDIPIDQNSNQATSTEERPTGQLVKSDTRSLPDHGNIEPKDNSTNPSNSGLPITQDGSPSSDEFVQRPIQLVRKLKNSDELNVEDTHTRKTYLIDNQLLAELDAVSAGKKKGFKTKIINTGLRIVLELMRQDNNFKL